MNEPTGFSLRQMQAEHKEWTEKNFGNQPEYQPLLGVIEESGELFEALNIMDTMFNLVKSIGRLSHAQLKSEQDIRNNEDHNANAKDAVADIVIYLTGYCTAKGFDIEQVVQETWEQVKQRDWRKNPENGG